MWHNVSMATLTTPASYLRFDLASVESGVPIDSISAFAESSGIQLKEIYDIVIPSRTLKHRRANKQPLSRDESDKLARLVRTFDQAVKVFGSPEKALRWLSKPKERFAQRTPLNMLRTDVGGRMVEELIGQIAEGFFA
jgi:putative toxin-antitoxin system antitoxin component (TIGR02293 family)